MEMKEYMTPAMEVIKLSAQRAVLQAVSGAGTTPPISDEDGGKDEF